MATTVRRDTAVSSPAQADAEQELLSFTPISALEAVGIQRGAASPHARVRPRDKNIRASAQRRSPARSSRAVPCWAISFYAAGDIKKFQDAGLFTADAVVMSSARHLERIKGLSEAKVLKAKEAAGKVCRRLGFQTANDLLLKRERDIIKITTGSAEFDKILGGGVETGSLTEVHGEWRTGKTQLALTLSVTSLMAEEQVPAGRGPSCHPALAPARGSCW
jgi:hypothetical protein